MVYIRQVSPKIRAYVKFHGENLPFYGKEKGAAIRSLAKKCKISIRTVYRLIKEPLDYDTGKEKLPSSAGRKRMISSRTEMLMIRSISKLRIVNRNWTARDLMNESGIKHVSERTVQRLLNRNGYRHLVARKKGVISEKDAKKRVQFAKLMISKEESFWKEDIAFYFDGVGFLHKTRPKESALSCKTKVWRKSCEGLHLHCTAKGSKVGYGGKQAKFFVAISYNRGVIIAEQYDILNGETFAAFIRKYFSEIFKRSGKDGKKWIQDGDPSQNSGKAKAAFQEICADLLSIPPRSPELNPIENVFAFVKKDLKTQAIEGNIEKESYNEFSLRVKATLYSSSQTRINNIINSYGKRLSKIIIRKGGRIEY